CDLSTYACKSLKEHGLASPEHNRFVKIEGNGTTAKATLCDLSGNPIAPPIALPPQGNVAGLDANGAILAWSSSRTITLLPLDSSGKAAANPIPFDGAALRDIRFSDDGQQMAWVGDSGPVIYNLHAGEPIRLRGHAARVSSWSFSRDGRKFASGGED